MKFLKSSQLVEVFFRAPGARPWSVFACVMLAGVLDMLSMGSILPAIGQIGGEGVASDSRLNQIVLDIVAFLGIEPTLVNFVGLIAGLLIAKSIVALTAMMYVAKSVATVQASIRTKLLRSVMNARWGYFVDLPPGQISNSIAGQTLHAGEAYNASAMVIVSTVQAIALLIAATLVSGYMVLLTTVAAIIISLPLYKLIMYARESGKKQWERAGLLGSKVQDAVGNMKAIKSMNRGSNFNDLFDGLVAELKGAYFAVVMSRHALSYGQDIMIAITVTGGVYFGSQILEMPLSDMLVLGIIYYQVITLVKRIQEHQQQAAFLQAAYFALMALIDRAEKQQEEFAGTRKPDLHSAFELKNVTFSYHRKAVLENINVEIPAGGITVLLGPSGAGKTTIIDIVTGLLSAQSGEVTVDGVPMSEVDMAYWRSCIGYVPQELTLLHGNVYDNVTLGDYSIPEQDVWAALREAGAVEFIDALPNKLKTHIGNMGAKLSGGQRQRLSLARALVRKPKLLVLDEVTSALDEKTEGEICRNINSLKGDYTIVAITHRPAWRNIATKLYEVSAGTATAVAVNEATGDIAAE